MTDAAEAEDVDPAPLPPEGSEQFMGLLDFPPEIVWNVLTFVTPRDV